MSDGGKWDLIEPRRELVWPGRTEAYRRATRARAHKRSDNRMKMRRAWWWNPEGVLKRLREGMPLVTIIAQGQKDAGDRKVDASMLYRDIRRWRRHGGFLADWDDALRIRDAQRGPSFSAEMKAEFLQAFEAAEGHIETACGIAGLGQGLVLSALDPKGTLYDKVFAERYRQIEAERIAGIRNKLFWHAEHGKDGRGDPKVQQKILESHVPHLHGPKVKIDVEGRVGHLHATAPALREAAATRSRALFAGREPAALPAADGRWTQESMQSARGVVAEGYGARMEEAGRSILRTLLDEEGCSLPAAEEPIEVEFEASKSVDSGITEPGIAEAR